ncbi:MAG: carboxy terminal-processing peptidase, partial [Verrucomicrobia bacterium]|nr:carboxy terminal-processing peptidase [Verrucomicrobiota bacterium]
PQWHLTQRPLDDSSAADALDRFLAFLDYDRSYFLSSDIEQFQRAVTNLDNGLLVGDVSFAYEVYDVLRARVSNRVEFADALLERGFDLDRKESYTWKRKDVEWPADEAAWDDLWRRKIKNQYIAHLVNRQLAGSTNGMTSADGATEAPDGEAEPIEETEAPPDLRLTPEEAIRKSYRQYLNVLNDNRAEWPVDRYLNAFAKAYDPHTDYMSASQTEDFEIGMKLSLVGIGARLTSEDGAAKIDQLISGGPAEKDGRLKAGDKIIAVAQGDGEPVSILHWPLNKAVRLIRGEKNTKVVLSVIPASDPSGTTVVKIDLIRDEVKLEDQAAKAAVKEVVDADGRTRRFGVITLPDFYADVQLARRSRADARSSAQDVRRLLRELSTNRIEGLVLDLRNNGGGLLAEAVRMTGLFIERGPVVQVSDGRRSQVMSDSDPAVVCNEPMIVLVNRQTASASEILAGALQDYGRAIIAGDSKTHGKGTVQTLADLKTGQPALGKLKVTTASFYRISGGSTQLRGITPDIVTPSSMDTLEIGEEFLPHALAWTRIQPLSYRPVDHLDELIPVLRQRVDERRRADTRYQAYLELLEQLAVRQKAPEVTLNLEERLAQARAEKELRDLLRKKDAGPGDDQADILLNESFQILCDLIALTTPPAETPPVLGAPEEPLAVTTPSS